MDQIKDRIEYGSRIMEYAIEYRARKTLGICVHPDGRIEVKAPVEASLEQIRSHVHRRASWIYRQQRYFDSLGIHSEVHTLEDTPHTYWFFRPWFDTAVAHMTTFLDRIFKEK